MTSELLTQIFISLAVVIGGARLGAVLFERMGQPAVVGEVVAGIALGPSMLGLIAPDVSRALVPTDVRPFLQLVAQLGLVIFMLVVGLEVEAADLRRRRRLIGAVSAGSTLVPFGLGVGLGLVLWKTYPSAGGHVPFVLFMGVALAVTAFPVLARIVRDRGMSDTPVGAVALACAAVVDVAAWIVLSVVVSMAGDTGHTWSTLPLALVFVVTMMVGVRPLLARASRRGLLDRLRPLTVIVFVVVAAVLSAWFTETIGLHSIFGPFVLGLALPRHRPTVELITTRLVDTSSGVLLPAFFVVAGLGVDVRRLDRGDTLVLAVTLALAVLGKIGGAALPARLTGFDGRTALTLGILLNTRGLTELVVLSVGLSVGVLHPDLYTILVITAVVTTVATGPLLHLVGRGRHRFEPDKASVTRRGRVTR